jgi:Zn-dependent protease/CBS domain-containing protein
VLGGRSFQLARVFGIRIGVDASWFVILFLGILWLRATFASELANDSLAFVAAVATAGGFFGSILLHELGHALAARRAGIEVLGIDLFFFGGVMKMNRDADSPGDEFKIAVAGPLATLLVVIAGTLAGIAIAGPTEFRDAALLGSSLNPGFADVVLGFVVSINVLLLGFNLVPAFPLDGGRIARAIVWKLTGDRNRATRFSARLGQLFAAILIGYGLYYAATSSTLSGLWYAVLGYLLLQSARAAMVQTSVMQRLEGVTVADIMDAEPVTIPAALGVERAHDEFFLRYQGWPWFAVVEDDGRFAGIAHRAAIETAVAERRDVPVRELAADSGEVRDNVPLEALLASEPLRSLGALMAVDAEGRLRGVVTLEQVSRALQARLAPG